MFMLTKFSVNKDHAATSGILNIAAIRQSYLTFGPPCSVTNMWNSLSSYVVSAESVNCWKNRLNNLGKIRLFIILVLRFMEPKTAVKLQFDSFSQ